MVGELGGRAAWVAMFAPVAALCDGLRAPSAVVLALSELAIPIPASISLRARSTVGRLKLLLPSGPTIPAAAVSVGFRKAPRGSRSGFLAFSS
jgi:hypothetical protein